MSETPEYMQGLRSCSYPFMFHVKQTSSIPESVFHVEQGDCFAAAAMALEYRHYGAIVALTKTSNAPG